MRWVLISHQRVHFPNRAPRGKSRPYPEVESIIEEQGKVEVTCEFCKDTVVFTEDELLSAKDKL